jgi:hypothetical protein
LLFIFSQVDPRMRERANKGKVWGH